MSGDKWITRSGVVLGPVKWTKTGKQLVDKMLDGLSWAELLEMRLEAEDECRRLGMRRVD